MYGGIDESKNLACGPGNGSSRYFSDFATFCGRFLRDPVPSSGIQHRVEYRQRLSGSLSGSDIAGWWGKRGRHERVLQSHGNLWGYAVRLLVCGVVVAGLGLPVAAQSDCEQVYFGSGQPGWVSSVAMWRGSAPGFRRDSSGQPQVLITDSIGGKILLYGRNGVQRDLASQFARLIDAEQKRTYADQLTIPFRPSAVKTDADGNLYFQLGERAEQFRQVTFSGDLLVPEFQIGEPQQKATGATLAFLWQWGLVECPECPDPRKFVVGFADLQDAETKEWSSNMVRFPWGEPSRVEILGGDFEGLTQRDAGTPVKTFFRLAPDLVATVQERAYVLRMDEKPALYEYSLKHHERGFRKLSSDLLGARPPLPQSVRFKMGYPAILAANASASGVTSIYPFEEGLLVLYRDVSSAGVRWFLRRLDLTPVGGNGGRLSNPVEIKGLTAPHVRVAAGTEYFAFVEQEQPLKFFAEEAQQTPGMLLVPKSQLVQIGYTDTVSSICQ